MKVLLNEFTIGPFTITGKFIKSLFRYLIVGFSTFFLDYFLNWLLIDIVGVNYLLVGYIAAPIVLLFNFTAHKVWSFSDAGSLMGRTRTQMIRYLMLVVFNTVANMGLMYVFYDLLELPLLWARVVCVGIGIMWNFPVFRFWVYKG